MTFRRFAKGQRPYRRVKGVMTGLEKRWGERLELLMRAGEIEWYAFEAVTLKLAADTRYTPDFVVMTMDGTLEFHECKGFVEDDAWVKIKVAAAMFPFKFVLARVKAKKDGGGWDIKTVGGGE